MTCPVMRQRLGRAAGFGYRRTWSRELPTDGVWVLPGSAFAGDELPVAALEVVVTEGPKSIKGSLDILAEVSPALGVLVIHEEEIRRGLVRRGVLTEEIDRRLNAQFEAARDRVTRHGFAQNVT